jgi:hypothetical protein
VGRRLADSRVHPAREWTFLGPGGLQAAGVLGQSCASLRMRLSNFNETLRNIYNKGTDSNRTTEVLSATLQ